MDYCKSFDRTQNVGVSFWLFGCLQGYMVRILAAHGAYSGGKFATCLSSLTRLKHAIFVMHWNLILQNNAPYWAKSAAILSPISSRSPLFERLHLLCPIITGEIVLDFTGRPRALIPKIEGSNLEHYLTVQKLRSQFDVLRFEFQRKQVPHKIEDPLSKTPKVKVGYSLISVGQTTMMRSRKLPQLLIEEKLFCWLKMS